MVDLKEDTKAEQTKDSGNWLFWTVIVLVVLILIFGGLVIKSAFFEKEIPRTSVERDLLIYRSQVESNPDDPVAHVNLGQTYFEIGQEDKAVKEFEKAISLDSQYAEPHYFLAVIYERRGEANEAVDELKKTIELSPSHDFACFLLGQIYLEQEEYEEAIEILRKCIELDPVSASAHYSLGLAYEKTGKNDLAISEYEETLRYVPDYDDAMEALERLTTP